MSTERPGRTTEGTQQAQVVNPNHTPYIGRRGMISSLSGFVSWGALALTALVITWA